MKNLKYLKLKYLLLSLVIFAVFASGCGDFAGRKALNNISSNTSYTSSEEYINPPVESIPDDFEKPGFEMPEKYTPDLWVAENGETGGKLYLFGSIHVGVPDMYPLPPEVIAAFDESDILAVENDIIETEKDISLQLSMLQHLMYTDGTTLKNHIDDNLYNFLDGFLRTEGYSIEMVNPYMPIFSFMLIDQLLIEKTEFKYDYGIDEHLLISAKERNMQILEVEPYDSVYKALGEISLEAQKFILESELSEMGTYDMEDELAKIVSAWITGDFESELAEENADNSDSEKYTDTELGYIAEYDNAILSKRNAIMTEAALEYLQTDKTYFYVVGLAHYFGEDGIINKISEAGYEIHREDYGYD